MRLRVPAPRRLRSLALLALLGSAFALASLADAPRSEADPLDLGEENSWLRVQNIGRRDAKIEIEFFDLDGTPVGSDRCPREGACEALRPGYGWSFFQQEYAELDEGYRGSAVVSVDQPFVALLARDVFENGQFRIAWRRAQPGARNRDALRADRAAHRPIRLAHLPSRTPAPRSRPASRSSTTTRAPPVPP